MAVIRLSTCSEEISTLAWLPSHLENSMKTSAILLAGVPRGANRLLPNTYEGLLRKLPVDPIQFGPNIICSLGPSMELLNWTSTTNEFSSLKFRGSSYKVVILPWLLVINMVLCSFMLVTIPRKVEKKKRHYFLGTIAADYTVPWV